MKSLITLFIACLSISVCNAQSISYPTPAGDLSVCSGSSLLTATITGADPTSEVVDVLLTSGVEYTPNSFVLTSGSGTIVEGGTPNNPTFTISGASDPFTFTLERTATCGAYTHALSAGIFKDAITSGTVVEDDPLVNFYQAVYPTYTITQPAPLNNVVLGSTHTRSFSFQNNGQGCSDTAFLKIDFQQGISPNGDIVADGVSFSPDPTLSTATTLIYKIYGTPTFAGGLCDTDPAIQVSQPVIIDDCNISPTSYELGWGCDFDNQCQVALTTGSATLQLQNPDLDVVFTENPSPSSNCAASPYSTISAVITNNGTGPAFDVVYTMGNYYINSEYRYYPYALDTASIMVDGIHPSNITVDADQTILKNIYVPACAVGQPSLANVAAPGLTIPAGQSVTITWNVNLCPGGACGDGFSRARKYGMEFDYTNQCGAAISQDPEGIPYFGIDNRINAIIPQVPAQVRGGDCFTYKVDISAYKTPNAVDEGYAEATITLPSGMTINNLATDIVEIANGNNDYHAGYPQQVGQDVIVRWKPGRENTLTFLICTDLTSCGANTIPLNVTQVVDSTCPVSPIARQCDASSFDVICPGPCPTGGVVPTDWTFERSSYGLPDNDQDGLADVGGALDFTKIDLDRYQAGDTLHSSYTGYVLNQTSPASITNWNNVIGEWKFNFGTWTAGTADITLLRGGVAYVATGVPITTITPNKEFKADWSAATFSPALPATYIQDDSIYVEADFVWTPPYTSNVPALVGAGTHANIGETPSNSDADAPDVAQLTHTVYASQAPPSGTVTNTVDGFTCFIPKYNANVIGNWNFTYASIGLAGNGAGCGEKEIGFVSYNRRLSRYSGAQYFAYEYRPMRKQDSIAMNIPAGWAFVGLSNTVDYQYYTTSAGGTGSTNIDGLIPYTVTGDATTGTRIVWDFKTAYDTGVLHNSSEGSYLAQRILVAPSCATPGAIDVQSEDYGFWQHYPDSTGALRPYYSQETRVLSYAGSGKPDIALQNLSGIVQAASLVNNYFDVQISGTTSYDAPFIWLATEKIGGISVVGVEYPIGTPLTIDTTYGTDKDMYYIDSAGWNYPTNEVVRVYFTMEDCGSDSLKIRSGWNCTEFPFDADNVCESKDMVVQAVTENSEIQLLKTLEPAVGSTFDICSTLNYEIRVRSTQNGDIDDPSASIIIPPGMTVVGNSFTYSYPGNMNPETFVVAPTGSQYDLNLENHSLIDTTGIKGVTEAANTDERTAFISYQLQVTTCDFVSGSNPQKQVFANGICGEAATGDGLSVNSTKLFATPQNPTPALTEITTLSSPTVSCSAPATVTTTITSADNDTYVGDSAVILIPAPLQYISGTLNVTGGSIVSSSESPNEIHIVLGPQAGNTVSIEYQVEPTTTHGCDTTAYEITRAVYRSSGFNCPASFGSCQIAEITDADTSSFTILRPQLDVVGFTYGNSYGSGTVSYSVDVNNSGTSNAPASKYVVSIYCGADSSGTPLHSFVTDAVAMNATVNHTGTLTYTSAECPPGNHLYATIQDTTAVGENACQCATPVGFVSTSVPLPIILKDFYGITNADKSNTLFWNVDQEENVSHYELERKVDGKTAFEKIATINSKVNGNGFNTSYDFNDINPSGDDEYRVKIVDQDLQSNLTHVVHLKNDVALPNASILPNPARDQFKFVLNIDSKDALMKFALIDAVGRTVLRRTEILRQGSNVLSFDVSKLATGNYILQYVNEDSGITKGVKLSIFR